MPRDLTEAIEAYLIDDGVDLNHNVKAIAHELVVMIGADVREQVATAIEAELGTTIFHPHYRFGMERAARIARTPAPIPPTSEDQCETCGRILDCSGNCSKGCAQ